MKMTWFKNTLLTLLLVLATVLNGCAKAPSADATKVNEYSRVVDSASKLPQYTGKPYTVVNDNKPMLDPLDARKGNFELYADLDEFGRCGVAYANICKELMPTEKRGQIGQVKPSGWKTVRYDDLVDGKYLYNRCHLIGFQLAGENANPKNLITGTRYLNIDGMVEHENMVADYAKRTGNHVLYRVTPVFVNNELVCRGLFIEALSVEDNGRGVCFHIYAHNVQPGIVIDYATGNSQRAER